MLKTKYIVKQQVINY